MHYASDLAKVERVAVETAREVLRAVPGGDPDAAPGFMFRSFAESAIDCLLILRVRAFEAQGPLRHALIVALQRRFREEGIVMPYPTRTLDLAPEVESRMAGADGAARPGSGARRDAAP